VIQAADFFFGDLDNTPSLGKEKSYQPTCVEILLLVLSREWMGMGEWDDYY